MIRALILEMWVVNAIRVFCNSHRTDCLGWKCGKSCLAITFVAPELEVKRRFYASRVLLLPTYPDSNSIKQW